MVGPAEQGTVRSSRAKDNAAISVLTNGFITDSSLKAKAMPFVKRSILLTKLLPMLLFFGLLVRWSSGPVVLWSCPGCRLLLDGFDKAQAQIHQDLLEQRRFILPQVPLGFDLQHFQRINKAPRRFEVFDGFAALRMRDLAEQHHCQVRLLKNQLGKERRQFFLAARIGRTRRCLRLTHASPPSPLR